jgi:hypothetical protein
MLLSPINENKERAKKMTAQVVKQMRLFLVISILNIIIL